MTREEQCLVFEKELGSLIIRFGEEFPLLTIGDVIQALEKEKFVLLARLHCLVQKD